MAEVIRQVRQPWLHGHAIGFEPLLSVGVVAQDGLGFRQHRVGGCDARPGQAQPALVDQAAQALVLGRVGLPIALQEEQALHGKHPARFLLQRQQGSLDNTRDAEPVVFLGGMQPVGIPVAGFAEHQDLPGVRRNPQPGAQRRLLRARHRRGGHADL